MSQDENLGRKEKKAQRDADRRKKGKKRKHAEIGEESNVEQQNEFDKDFLPLDSGVVEKKDGESDKKSTKKSSRKRKADELEDVPQTKQQEADTHSTAKKSKKRKKNKDGVAKGETNGVEAEPVDKTQAHRFIVFVGNLPYNATDATIKAHFKKLEPFNLRHRTDPKTDKSKGFAFLEFENYDRMKTCLKLYHHSMFDLERTAKGEDPVLGEGEEESGERKKSKDVKPSKGARRINVELTAGGGGKAEGRKEKIRVKNERLGQQRQRRADAEKKEREKKAKEEGEASVAKPVKKKAKAGAESDAAKPVKQMSEKVETYGVAEGMTDVHPSRLARIAA
jgi:nucleolar protein 6